ncbi:hypothetical protein CPT_Seuss114 [Caulobacter phage Seuss]|uniref:Uncharacterized protein n=1 Tax=Caulobacter phage Seuss TaxID=1675601 RepID=A0A0K1LNC2_9CAUD|nr:hypothetical protein HOR08_gp114 [Caulobacter phage Seuss]AKU43640.1 hypothetical protein CPT_Seuss114 [Caulobacter phage Seuss]
MTIIRILYQSWLARRILHHQTCITAEFANPRSGMAVHVMHHRSKIRDLEERLRASKRKSRRAR